MPDDRDRQEIPTPERDDALARRTFIRKSAEVAALSMFGVAGLDAVVEGVIREVGRLTGDARMAGEAAEVLAETGLGGVAEADCGCGPYPYECYAIAEYDPNCLVDVPHDCGDSYQPFSMPCGGIQGRFDCHDETGSLYSPRCMITSPADDPFSCPNDQQPTFDCGGSAIFSCGDLAFPQGVFNCGDGQTGFVCNGEVVDFICEGAFACLFEHDCQGQHMFGCYADVGPNPFHCVNSFKCGAGGYPCGIPGVGGYDQPDDDNPGDFYCGRDAGDLTFGDFECRGSFTCTDAEDDFVCTQGAQGSAFQCTETHPFDPINQCPSGDGQRFRCSPGDFHCDSQDVYLCSEPAYPFTA